MSDVTIKKVEEIEYYQGPKALPGIKFHSAGKALGIRSWGMNVLELEPNCTSYFEHDHAKEGIEEVYTLLRGSATIRAGDREEKLEPGTLIRVGPKETRKILAGPQGAVVLALGGTPGKAYEPRY